MCRLYLHAGFQYWYHVVSVLQRAMKIMMALPTIGVGLSTQRHCWSLSSQHKFISSDLAIFLLSNLRLLWGVRMALQFGQPFLFTL